MISRDTWKWAATLIALASCDPPPKQTVTPDAPIIIGTTDAFTDLDPALAYDALTWELFSNIGEPLMALTPGTTTFEPRFAREEPSVSADGLTYTFKLRPNALFADGTPADAAAMKYSLDRAIALATPAGPNWLITDFVDHVEAPDAETLVFVLKSARAYYKSVINSGVYLAVNQSLYPADKLVSSTFTEIADMAAWQMSFVDQTALDATKVMGYGAYRIESLSYDKQKGAFGAYTELKLRANPDYFGTVKTDEIVLRFYGSAEELRDALINKEIDVAWRTLNPPDVDTLRADMNYTTTEVVGKIRFICMNTTIAPFSDPALRRAVAAAIDRRPIISEIFHGFAARPLYSLIPNGLWSHKDVFKDKYGERNLDMAKSLLGAAGYTESNKLTITFAYTFLEGVDAHYGDTEPAIAQMLKAQLEETGLITVNLLNYGWSEYKARQPEYQLSLYGWYPDYVDPDNFTAPFVVGGHDYFGTGFAGDVDLDALVDAAGTNLDFTQRQALYEQVQTKSVEDAVTIPYVPLFQQLIHVVTQKDITIATPGPDGTLYYREIERIK